MTDTEQCFVSFYRDLLEFAKENDDVVHEIAKRYTAYTLYFERFIGNFSFHIQRTPIDGVISQESLPLVL